MQRKLTAQLAHQSGFELISFQHFDCLVFERGETSKFFLPQSKRILGGKPQDRMVIGDLVAIFSSSIERLQSPSKRYRFEDFIVSIPTANFPSITACSSIVGETVDHKFFSQIHDLLNNLPDTKAEWETRFSEDFFGLDAISRCVEAVQSLRAGH